MGGTNIGGWQPFQNVSWTRPFGDSDLGNAVQGVRDAPLTPGGVVKETGEQLYFNPDAPGGAGGGIPISTVPRSIPACCPKPGITWATTTWSRSRNT